MDYRSYLNGYYGYDAGRKRTARLRMRSVCATSSSWLPLYALELNGTPSTIGAGTSRGRYFNVAPAKEEINLRMNI